VNLPHALNGVGLLGIDSAPLIYLVEKHPIYFDAMVFILRTINSGSITAVSSMLTLTEVLTQPLRADNEILVREYEDILQNSVGFELLPLNVSIARKAADLRAHYNLKTPDAIQVATCINAGCTAFLTNDLRLKRVTEMQIMVLDELELEPPQMKP
jgi:predicted nucleic acid-binding protein